MKETLLLIEDEDNILQLLKFHFEKSGFSTVCAQDGELGLQLALKHTPALILLDLMLPKMDGLEVCKTLRKNKTTRNIPIIMLTAKGGELDKVVGLELGADDYVTKPFSPRELEARVQALLRRSRSSRNTPLLKAGTLQMDLSKHLVSLKQKTLSLTSKEFDLLKLFLESEGNVLSRDMLLQKIWGFQETAHIETRTVDMHVGSLRKKLGPESKRFITVKNVGYRFVLE